MIFLYIFAALLLLFLLYLFAIHTRSGRQSKMEPYKITPIAHRGLFNNTDIPENSIPAFKKAVEAGYGIELDVQLTSDKKLVVFHDEKAERICGQKAVIHKTPYEELLKYNLLGTNEKIPLFEDVLKLVNGAVPLIVEIKTEGDYLLTSEMTDKLLKKYNGEYCIESFHPLVLRWFKKNSPDIIRGQLSTNHLKNKVVKSYVASFFLTNLLLNFLAVPDFIAYNHIYKNQFSFKLCRKLYKPVSVAWTIKSQEDLENAKDSFDVFIFDSFIPKK